MFLDLHTCLLSLSQCNGKALLLMHVHDSLSLHSTESRVSSSLHSTWHYDFASGDHFCSFVLVDASVVFILWVLLMCSLLLKIYICCTDYHTIDLKAEINIQAFPVAQPNPIYHQYIDRISLSAIALIINFGVIAFFCIHVVSSAQPNLYHHQYGAISVFLPIFVAMYSGVIASSFATVRVGTRDLRWIW